jgi:pimeloyl-ACP methyl ester carboxylesterase
MAWLTRSTRLFINGDVVRRYFLLPVLLVSCFAIYSVSSETTPDQRGDDIEFMSGGDSVRGVFYSAVKPEFTVLLLHGFPGNPRDVLGLGKRLTSDGINVMTFSYRGTCASGGTYSLANSQQDIASAWRILHSPEFISKYSIDTARLILGGYSFGGGMGLTYAAGHDDVKKVFSIAGTDHGEFARRYASDTEYAAVFDNLFKELEAPDGPVRFVGKDALAELIEHANEYDLRMAAPKLSEKNLLIIGGLDDENVTLEEYLLPLYRALESEGASSLQFEIVPDNHSFSHVRDRLFTIVRSWIKNRRDI